MIPIEYGDRPAGHDNLGFTRAHGSEWHLISFETWNQMTFCGKQSDGPIERFASGHVCGVCSQLTGICHSEYTAA